MTMLKKHALALLAIAVCAPLWAADLSEDDALNLADATVETTQTQASNWRIFRPSMRARRP